MYDEKTVRKKWNDQTPAILKELADLLSSISDFTAQNIETTFKSFLAEKELSFGRYCLFSPCSNGFRDGTSMFQISALLGKEELRRNSYGITKIKK